ncbi:MAG: cell division septation protein DedD [Paracoccaceae bacterium]|jgi:cell division septation protein DedD
MADDFRPDEDDRIAPGEPSEAAPYGRRGRRIMTGLVAVAAVLGFGVVLVYAYNKGKQDGPGKTPPVIQAQEGPSKIRPENPGGMKVPNRDKEVFNRLETDKQAGGVERLLPPPEKPMAPPAPPPAIVPGDVAKMAPSAGTGGNVAVPLKPAMAPPPAAPKEIKPLAVTPPKGPPAPATAKKPRTPPKKVAAKTPAAKPKPSVKSKPAAKAGAYRVQMASLRSRGAVQKNWATLKRKHPDLLGKLGLSIQSVKLSGGRGTYYRMQAGPLRSKAQATALCSSLKKRKQGCIVVRR